MGEVISFPRAAAKHVIKLPIAHRIGAIAAEAGIAFLDNPYAPGTEQHREWAGGWCDYMGSIPGECHVPTS